MDFYGIGNIFRQVTDRAGLGAGLLVLFLLGIVAVILFLGRRALDQRSQERAALIGEVTAARQQMYTLMTNHIAHLSSSQESFTQFQTNVVRIQEGTLKNLSELLDQQKRTRDELAAGMAKMLDQHNETGERLARIEGKLL